MSPAILLSRGTTIGPGLADAEVARRPLPGRPAVIVCGLRGSAVLDAIRINLFEWNHCEPHGVVLEPERFSSPRNNPSVREKLSLPLSRWHVLSFRRLLKSYWTSAYRTDRSTHVLPPAESR